MTESAAWSVLLAQLCGLLSVLRARCPLGSPLYYIYTCLHFNLWYALTEAQPGSWQYLAVWCMLTCACWCDMRLCSLVDDGPACAYVLHTLGANLQFLVFLFTRSHVGGRFIVCACVSPFVRVLALMAGSSLERQMWALVESCMVQNLFFAVRGASP